MRIARYIWAIPLLSESLVDRILSEVRAFSGDQPQEDDQTIVVARVES